MKNILILFICLFALSVGSVNAQFAADSSKSTRVIKAQGEADFPVTTAINGPFAKTDYNWYRSIISMPSDWEYAICDPFLCHSRETDTASYFLEAGSGSEIIVHFYVPHTSGGMGVVRVINEDDATKMRDTAIYVLQTWNEFLSTNEPEKLVDEVKVYPNPSASVSEVNLVSTSTIQNIDVVDLTGKIIKSITLTEYNNTYKLKINDIANGLYIVRVKTTSGSVKTTKLEVSK